MTKSEEDTDIYYFIQTLKYADKKVCSKVKLCALSQKAKSFHSLM